MSGPHHSPPGDVSSSRSWWAGTGVIAVAMGIMNLSTYAFTILAARLLGPSEYGALAAVMGLLLVVNVVSLGLQATGARRVSAAPHDRDRIETEVLAAGYRSALAVGVVCVAATPLITSVLRLDNWVVAGLIAVAALPLTVMGSQAGIVQGERRWVRLAAIYLAMGLGRVIFGLGGLLVDASALGAMAGVAIGGYLPALVGRLVLRDRGPRSVRASGGWGQGGVLREVAHNSHALLAFFALSNADVVIARGVLDDRQSGLYAGGLILAKAVLFLPQFVVVIAFPAMAAARGRHHTHLRGLALVLLIGSVATAGAWLVSPLAVVFVGGAAYSDLEPLIWAFAVIGTLLAMIQLMVYEVVARQDQRLVLLVWAGLVALVCLAPAADSVRFLVSAVATVQALLLIALLLASLRRREAPTRAG